MFRLLIILAAVGLSGCKNKEREAREELVRNVMHGNVADPDITAAMEKAKATVGVFLEALQKSAPGQNQFLVKKVFPAEGGKQQILWVTNLQYDGKLLRGKVDDNTHQPGSGIPRDGAILFLPSEIADWMFNDNGKAAGGWLLRVFQKKFPDEWERKRYSERITAFREE